MGLGLLAGGEQGFPGAVERGGFPVAVAELLVQGKRLVLAANSLVMVALPVANPAKRGQRIGLKAPVAGPAGSDEGLLRVVGGLLVMALLMAGLAEVVQRLGLAGPVTDLPGRSECRRSWLAAC